MKNRLIYIQLLINFFLFRCGFQGKIEPSWRNYLIWTAHWGGEHNTPDTQNRPIIFLSVIAVMQVIFWTEDSFRHISNCRNSFNCQLKKSIKEQIIFFYSPSHVFCSSEKSVQIDHFKHHTSIVLCSLFTWFYLLILNFCQ